MVNTPQIPQKRLIAILALPCFFLFQFGFYFPDISVLFYSGKHSAGSKLSNPELDYIYRIRERDFSRTQSTQSDSRTCRWDQSWISGRRSSRASAQPSGGTRGNGHLFLWRSRRVNCFLLWGLLSHSLSTPSRRHPGGFHLLNPAYSGGSSDTKNLNNYPARPSLIRFRRSAKRACLKPLTKPLRSTRDRILANGVLS